MDGEITGDGVSEDPSSLAGKLDVAVYIHADVQSNLICKLAGLTVGVNDLADSERVRARASDVSLLELPGLLCAWDRYRFVLKKGELPPLTRVY